MSLHDTVDHFEKNLNKQRYHKAWFTGIVCEHDFRDAFVLQLLKDQNYQPLVIDINEFNQIGSSDVSLQDFIDNKIGETLAECPKHERPIIVMANFQHIQNAGEQSYIKLLMDIETLFKAKTLTSESEQFIPVFFSSCYYYDFGIACRFPGQETWYITNSNIRDVKSLAPIHEQIENERRANYARIRAEEDAKDDWDYANHETDNSHSTKTNTHSDTDSDIRSKIKNRSGYF